VSGAIRGIFTATTGAEARQRLLRLAGMLLLEQNECGWSAAVTCPRRPWPWGSPAPDGQPTGTARRWPSSLLPDRCLDDDQELHHETQLDWRCLTEQDPVDEGGSPGPRGRGGKPCATDMIVRPRSPYGMA
jgi:hypothetical protein